MGTSRIQQRDVARRRDTAESNITFREVFNRIWALTSWGPRPLRLVTVPLAIAALVVAYVLLGICDVLFAPVHVARRIRWSRDQAAQLQTIEQMGQQQVAIQQAYFHRQADLKADQKATDVRADLGLVVVDRQPVAIR